MHEWKSGDLVTVVKVNKGLPVRQPREELKLQGAAESWAGEIAGPSLIGHGWWNVQSNQVQAARGRSNLRGARRRDQAAEALIADPDSPAPTAL